MSTGFPHPASVSAATGGNLFPNLPRAISTASNSATTVSGLLQQQLNSGYSSSNPAGGFGSSVYPQNPAFFGHPYFAAIAAQASQTNSLSPNQQQHPNRIKLKRTRQRVDAGEPRNTYSSFIPAYQKIPALYSTPASNTPTPRNADPIKEEFHPASNHLYIQNLLRGMHYQQPSTPAESTVFQETNGEKTNGDWTPATVLKESDEKNGPLNGVEKSRDESPKSDPESEHSPKPDPAIDPESGIGSMQNEEKKMDSPNSTVSGQLNGGSSSGNRSKRKQYQPQQLDTAQNLCTVEQGDDEDQTNADPLLLSMTTTDFEHSDDEAFDGKSLNGECDEDEDAVESAKKTHDPKETVGVNEEIDLDSGDDGAADNDEEPLDETEQMEMQQIKRMQNELMFMQQRYIEALAASQQQQQKQRPQPQRPDKDQQKSSESKPVEKSGQPTAVKDMKTISEELKSDLCGKVDEWMDRLEKLVQAEVARRNATVPMFNGQPPIAQQSIRPTIPPLWPPKLENQQSVNPTSTPVSTATAPGPVFGPPPPPMVSQENASMPSIVSTGPRPYYFNPFMYNQFPYASAGLNFAAAAAAAAAGHQPHPPSGFMASSSMAPPNAGPTPNSAPSTIFPSFPPSAMGSSGPTMNSTSSPYMGLNLSHKSNSGTMEKRSLDDTSISGSLPMPRKKRSKVTDTRVTKLNFRNDDLGQQFAAAAAAAAAHQLRGSPATSGPGGFFASNAYPPTLLPPHLLNPHQSPFASSVTSGLSGNGGGRGSSNFDDSDPGAISPDISDGTGSEMTPYDPNMPQSTTLSPMHLRKAKLMFFYTRYPSSALLKAYFPDIRFNKNNTAQLVKWFSNFREFYYIQMEKYARQALAEGIQRTDQIHVSMESELYKVLNLHYNRNNHIQVPPNFRAVVEQTLREFFLAIQAGRDAEPSWKKAIYKVIARLDDPIPEYFKTPNFLEQLE